MISFIPVAGTHDWNPVESNAQKWWHPASRFTAFMAGLDAQRLGMTRLGKPAPFWPTGVNGTKVAGQGLREWHYGGDELAEFALSQPRGERRIIALSHGGQVAPLAIAKMQAVGETADCLVTVGTPVRGDMERVYRDVDCPWMHFYSTGWENRMQFLGQLMDKQWSLSMKMPSPAENRRVEGIGHARLLREPAKYEAVYRDMLMPFLRAVGETS